MDAAGAGELHRRIEEHQHWRQAAAVRDGRQPAADPDAQELEEIGDGLRLYGREEQRLTVDGRPALVTLRVAKRLVNGHWERDEIMEDPDDGPGRASRTGLVRPGDSSQG
jgi:hypothetical protein